MVSVTGFTAERMLAIENSTVVSGEVIGDHLILTLRDGTQIDAGDVRGPLPLGDVAPDGDTIPQRTSDGRLKTATPLEPDDAVSKTYADAIASRVGTVIEGTELGNAVDLNTYTTAGIYTQTSNVEAASGLNYPAAYAGVLEVFNNQGPVNMVWQRYTLYGPQADRFYMRSFYVSWQPWRRFNASDGPYDTGWVSTGLAIGVGTGWRVNSYMLRRVGTRITGAIKATYSGTAVTAGTDANFGDMNGVLTMPSGWRNMAGAVAMIPVWREGFNMFFGRANADGLGGIDVVHGSFGSQAMPTATEYEFMIDYYTD